MKIKRTERGWAGHFCCADRCLFRRNTLLEDGETRIVVSTVGLLLDDYKTNTRSFREIGCNRHFETMAFHARRVDDRYWDADVSREVEIHGQWRISEIDADDKANDMHEVAVAEITERIKKGEFR